MKWEKIKEILDEQYPHEGAVIGDVIGEKITCPEEVDTILTTLDVTLDTIAQAKEAGAQVIVSHHPFWWGEREEALNKNKYLKSVYDLMVSQGIGLYTAHTNADFATNSLAYMMGLALDLEDIEQNDQNLSVTGYLNKSMKLSEFADLVRDRLELPDFVFRTNIDAEESVKKITISSGTAGEYGIFHTDHEALHCVGEIKHHEWVQANQVGVKVMEFNHFSEHIFKSMVEVLLDKEEVKVIKSKETNGYKIL